METNVETPYIMTVCSGKGGIGKSVLSANIAAELASDGYNTLIIDADRYFPNQHLMLGIEPPVRLHEVYQNRLQPVKAVFKIKENLSIMADLPGSSEYTEFDPSKLIDVITSVISDKDFDFIIIDTPAGASREALQCCSFADTIALVVNDEPTSLLDAYGLIKLLLKYVNTEKINLLINNVIDFEDADEISRKLNLATDKFLELEFRVLGYVPYDRAVRQSIIRQELFINGESATDLTRSIKTIAGHIIQKAGIEQIKES